MDVSVTIPAASSSMETICSDERVAAIIVPRNSPSFKTLSLGLDDDETTAPPSPSPRRSSSAEKMTGALLVKKLMAEFLGVFLLVFVVLSAVITDATRGGALGTVGVAAAAGLAVAVTVASLVHASGAHINPAVSVAMAAFGYLPRRQLAPYVAAQLLGSVTASFAAKLVYHPAANLGAITTTVSKLGAAETFAVEFFTTFVLLFVVVTVDTNPRAAKELVGVAAGAAVMVGALISGASTGASMNPARTLGPAIAAGTYTKIWVYMVAPPLGAVAGAGACIALKH